MGQAEVRRDHSIRLDEVLLYLLVREIESRPEGYKIPISKVHDVIYTVAEELESEFGFSLKFNENGPQIHSPQLEEAINDIVPYSIPVRNPSFSLEVSPDVAKVASASISKRIPEDERSFLDSLSEEDQYRSTLNNKARSL